MQVDRVYTLFASHLREAARPEDRDLRVPCVNANLRRRQLMELNFGSNLLPTRTTFLRNPRPGHEGRECLVAGWRPSSEEATDVDERFARVRELNPIWEDLDHRATACDSEILVDEHVDDELADHKVWVARHLLPEPPPQ